VVGPVTYLWSTGETTQSINTGETTLVVTVTDTGIEGCSSTHRYQEK